jgi:predicted MPP superfamily phosphohydrolase
MGTSIVPVRFFAPPEVVVHVLEPDQAEGEQKRV